ncbi:heterokaryon incompatibility protein-domain-containing protein, partial [Lineolata rhizophorae]
MADSPSTLSFTDSRNDVDAVYGSVPIEPEKRDVRLLQLQPGSYNDPIVCSLRVVSLLDHPEYQALSYCWEDPTDRKPITVNSNKFFVTSALECALRNIRDKNIQKLLWVDAICINLQDVREKNHQVRHMMKIFRFADIVLIWLGGKTNDSELAMKMLDDLASLYHLRQYWVRKNRHGLQALRKLLSRPYWHRRWVVEEIAASTKLPMVGCGNKWLSW